MGNFRFPHSIEAVHEMMRREAPNLGALRDTTALHADRDRSLEDYLNNLPTGGGSRWGTIVVAASDSTAAGKAAADFVCDEANASTALQEAFGAATNDEPQGGEVTLLEGTYVCQERLSWWTNLRIRGMGPGTLILRGEDLDDYLMVGSGGGDRFMQSVVVGDDAGTSTFSVIFIAGSQNDAFLECDLSASDIAYALEFGGASGNTGLRLIHNYFTGSSLGVFFKTGQDASVPSGRSYVIGNVFDTSENVTPNGLIVDTSQALVVAANHFYSCGMSLQAGTRGVAVEANSFFRSPQHMISMDAVTRCLVHANVGLDAGNQTNNTYDGIIVTGNSTYNKVTDNLLADAATANKVRNAIRLDAGSDNNIVAHNDVYGSYATAGVADAAAGTITWGGNRT